MPTTQLFFGLNYTGFTVLASVSLPRVQGTKGIIFGRLYIQHCLQRGDDVCDLVCKMITGKRLVS